MRAFAVFATAFVATASVSAQTTAPQACNMSLLLPLVTDPSLTQCTSDSGLSFPPTAAALTADVLQKACKSQACIALVDKVRALGVGDCLVGTFKLESDLFTPLKAACASSGGSKAGSGAGPTPTTAPVNAQEETPETPKTVPSPAPTPSRTSAGAATLSASASAIAAVVVTAAVAFL